MKKLIFVVLSFCAAIVHAQDSSIVVPVTTGADEQKVVGARCIVDFSRNYSYAAKVFVSGFGIMELAEFSLGEINSSEKSNTVNSQLAYLDPNEVATFLKLPRPIYVDYVLVKCQYGRFIPAQKGEKDAVRLIFKYGNLLPLKNRVMPLVNGEDERNVGVFDLSHVVFYEMSFLKQKGKITIYQTAMTKFKNTDDNNQLAVSMQLISFVNSSSITEFQRKDLPGIVYLESVNSVWWKKTDYWASVKNIDEVKWKPKKIEKYTLNIIWNADVPNALLQTDPKKVDKQKTKTDTVPATKIIVKRDVDKNGVTTFSWKPVSGAVKYLVSFPLDNGTMSDHETKEPAMAFKTLKDINKVVVKAINNQQQIMAEGTLSW